MGVCLQLQQILNACVRFSAALFSVLYEDTKVEFRAVHPMDRPRPWHGVTDVLIEFGSRLSQCVKINNADLVGRTHASSHGLQSRRYTLCASLNNGPSVSLFRDIRQTYFSFCELEKRRASTLSVERPFHANKLQVPRAQFQAWTMHFLAELIVLVQKLRSELSA